MDCCLFSTKALYEPMLSVGPSGTKFSEISLSNAFSWTKLLRISIKISLNFVPKGPINNIPALVQIMNQWWLVYWRIYASLGLNELIPSQISDYIHYEVCDEITYSFPFKCWVKLLIHTQTSNLQGMWLLIHVNRLKLISASKHPQMLEWSLCHDDVIKWKHFPFSEILFTKFTGHVITYPCK